MRLLPMRGPKEDINIVEIKPYSPRIWELHISTTVNSNEIGFIEVCHQHSLKGICLKEGVYIQIIIMWCSPTTLLAHQFPSVTLCHIFPSGNKQPTAIKVSFVLCVDHCIYNRENTFRSGSLVNLIRNRTAEVIAFENWYPNKIFWWFRKTEPAIRCHLQNGRVKKCYTIQMKLTVILE